MRQRQYRVVTLRVGTADLGPAVLTLTQDEPTPGVRGLKGWSVSGNLDSFGKPPEDAEASIVIADGRTLSGRVLLTGFRMSSSGPSALLFRGTGPLAGTTDEDYW